MLLYPSPEARMTFLLGARANLPVKISNYDEEFALPIRVYVLSKYVNYRKRKFSIREDVERNKPNILSALNLILPHIILNGDSKL